MDRRATSQPAYRRRVLPQDGHVHSQFSWDAAAGDMQATCARAVAIGLPSLAFTEHVDLTPWARHGAPVPAAYRGHVGADGQFLADPLEVGAYLASIQRCRDLFPDLRILSGIELSEGHWHPEATRALLAGGDFQRVLGSVHALADLSTAAPVGAPHVEVSDAYAQREPVDVVRAYLTEVTAMAASDAPFTVLAHIDYPLRHWPAGRQPLDLHVVEEEFRSALRTLAASGRALEVNTKLPLSPLVIDWWHQSGGDAVAFGSDAHDPDTVAHDFVRVAEMVTAHGFRPGSSPDEHWARS